MTNQLHNTLLAVDLADLDTLDRGNRTVAEAVAGVRAASMVPAASPTQKASFTGVLKLFRCQFPTGALIEETTIQRRLGGDRRHALVRNVKPVLAELGASSPTREAFLPDTDYAGSDILATTWLTGACSQLLSHLMAASSDLGTS